LASGKSRNLPFGGMKKLPLWHIRGKEDPEVYQKNPKQYEVHLGNSKLNKEGEDGENPKKFLTQ
jgi:hypothetical protein